MEIQTSGFDEAQQVVLGSSALVLTFMLSLFVPQMVRKAIGKWTDRWFQSILELSLYLFIVIGGTILGTRLLGWDVLQFLETFGIFTLGISYATKDVFGNMFAGVVMYFTRDVKFGQRINITYRDAMEGQVVRINLRSVTLVDGEKRHIIPNQIFLTHPFTTMIEKHL